MHPNKIVVGSLTIPHSTILKDYLSPFHTHCMQIPWWHRVSLMYIQVSEAIFGWLQMTEGRKQLWGEVGPVSFCCDLAPPTSWSLQLPFHLYHHFAQSWLGGWIGGGRFNVLPISLLSFHVICQVLTGVSTGKESNTAKAQHTACFQIWWPIGIEDLSLA